MEDRRLEQWEQRIREITQCRVCGNPSLDSVIDLDSQYIASLFNIDKRHDQFAIQIPLEVVRCRIRGRHHACGFVQLTHTVPPEVLYQDYGYRSGINTTMRRHLQALAHEVESRVALQPNDIVVDIGANDGTTLLAFQHPEIVKVGFEPSNIRPETPQHDLSYIPTFFNSQDFMKRFPNRKARVILSIAMLYDIDDPSTFCQEVYESLADDGFWVIEMSYLCRMMEQNAFDTICHEHLGYYTLQTLQFILQKNGLTFYDIMFNTANGGSLRCYVTKRHGRLPIPTDNQARIDQALKEEHERGYDSSMRYRQFCRNVEQIRRDLNSLLAEAHRKGKRVFGYGASTKGNVLLQYCGIGPQHLVALADRNPAKVGRATLGTSIPICSEEEMRQSRPDYLLVLPWHFLNEFLEREASLRASGTQFIVPFPVVHIV